MITVLTSPLGMEASSLIPAQQQVLGCLHLLINFTIRTWFKKKQKHFRIEKLQRTI